MDCELQLTCACFVMSRDEGLVQDCTWLQYRYTVEGRCTACSFLLACGALC